MPSPIYIGRWTPKILFALKQRPRRHGQLRRQIGGVSQRMLTRTLRNLEASGLIARRVRQSNVVAVEYTLTRLGRTLVAPLEDICRWARRHLRDVTGEVRRPANQRPMSAGLRPTGEQNRRNTWPGTK
jgi:DNA-binding HxlR family transcriptional regulator